MSRSSTPSNSYQDRKSTRLNSSHSQISYAVFCLKKKLRRTSVPSGPRGPGFTTVRRGSSLTGVFGSRNFLRSCAFSCVQLCEPKSKRKTIRPSAFVFILPSSTDEFLSQFHAFWAAQRELRAARWSRATRNLFQIFFIPALYFGASSFFSASANSLDHSPNAFSISSWRCARSIFTVFSTGHGDAKRSGRSAIQ